MKQCFITKKFDETISINWNYNTQLSHKQDDLALKLSNYRRIGNFSKRVLNTFNLLK